MLPRPAAGPQTRSLPAAGLESIVMSPSGVSSQHRFSCIQRGKKSFDSNYYMNFVYWKFHTYIQIDTDLTDVCRKFYGHLNIILSVVGRCANEMAAIHLTKMFTDFDLWLWGLDVIREEFTYSKCCVEQLFQKGFLSFAGEREYKTLTVVL